MPDATVSQELHHYDLKTIEGGYIKLRQLPYYDMLTRRDKGSIASMESQQQKGKRGEPTTTKMILESLQTWERAYMMKNCIVEHNLTDRNGVPLDFGKEMTLRMLNPKVGMEIEKLIDDLNSEGDEFAEDFLNAPSNSLEHQDQEQSILSETMDSVTT
jgi:hypothetical protein